MTRRDDWVSVGDLLLSPLGTLALLCFAFILLAVGEPPTVVLELVDLSTFAPELVLELACRLFCSVETFLERSGIHVSRERLDAFLPARGRRPRRVFANVVNAESSV